jgi:hypothetical protein
MNATPQDDLEPPITDGPIKTYSLEEVAAMVLPSEWRDGERWLARRLNRGEIHGYKLGRTWRMTHAGVEELIAGYSNTVKPLKPAAGDPAVNSPVSIIDGLSPQSRRRLRRLP